MAFVVDGIEMPCDEKFASGMFNILENSQTALPLTMFNHFKEDFFDEMVERFGLNSLLDDGSNFLIALTQETDNLERIRKLISLGIDLEFESKDGYTALMVASALGYIDYVTALVEAGAKVVGSCKLMSPLLGASSGGSIETVRFLLDHGAEVDEVSECGTPLAVAAKLGRLDIVKLLVERGATVNLGSSDKKPIIGAAMKNHDEMVKFLLDNGADANTRNDIDQTALTYAYAFANKIMLSHLIFAGARNDIIDTDGYRPSDYLNAETELRPSSV